MQKKSQFKTVTLVCLGLLVAIQVVFTQIINIEVGFARIAIGPFSTVLAGLWFGPLAGCICGVCGDLLGCFIKGYAYNPFITASSALWGVLPAVIYRSAACHAGSSAGHRMLIRNIILAAAVAVTACIGQLFLTTAGLVLISGYRLEAIMPVRLIQTALLTPVIFILSSAIYHSPMTGLVRSMTQEDGVTPGTASAGAAKATGIR